MSKKRKLTQQDNLQTVETVAMSEVMTFNTFISQSIAKGLARPRQEAEIHAFFRSLGLTDKEPSDKYKDALAKY
jgi:hypothetical protein